MDRRNGNKKIPRYQRYYIILLTFALILSLAVILLGAYTRLSDAGLGCPDWPGCYGKLVLPENQSALAQVQQSFPTQPIVPAKAWKEMIHRYFAGTLGLIIFILFFWSLFRRLRNPHQPILPALLLIGVVIVQVILGMWTVTMKVMPLVVMGHLMGGMSIAALLCWLLLEAKPNSTLCSNSLNKTLKPWVAIGLTLIILQIFLGAWTSTNYAALACIHFPLCRGSLFPPLDWTHAFQFATPIGPNYEGGRLAMNARVTIHMIHRYGAFLVIFYWLPLSLFLMLRKSTSSLRLWGWSIFILLCTQVSLGILNVIKLLPMPVALSHNGLAAIFLMTAVAFLHTLHART